MLGAFLLLICSMVPAVAFGQLSPAATPPASMPPFGCRSADPNHLCLGIKYVAFTDAVGSPVISPEEVQSGLDEINSVWGQCNLGFQIDRFVPARPDENGIRFQIGNYRELTQIRSAYSEPSSLLIVATGTWDRTGSLGGTSANAWTSLPGAAPYGAVLERPVAKFANIIGHELGHYLNLSHVNDSADLMNAIIYGTSTVLTAAQCDTARSAALYFWSRALR